MELLGRAVPALTFCGTSVLLSVVAAPPHIPARTAHEAPSHRRQLLFSRVFDDDHSNRRAVVSRCGSDGTSLVTVTLSSFSLPVGHPYVLRGKCLFGSGHF